jgi:hypothetical protein
MGDFRRAAAIIENVVSDRVTGGVVGVCLDDVEIEGDIAAIGVNL